MIQAPTPLHRLNHVSNELGIDLWIKRDDLTGFAMGGNKGRKLEYLIAEALATGAEAIVSCGSSQSNFIRHLGAACAMYGLKCAAAVMETPYEDELPAEPGIPGRNGNVRLNEIFGVDTRAFPNGTWDELYAQSDALAEEYRARGLRVYVIPIGGSSPLGAYSFLEAGRELTAGPFDWIVVATSSGSTQTGLSHAFRGTSTKVLGMACDPEPEIVDDFARLSEGLSHLVDVEPIPASEFLLNLDYVGPGYGVASKAGNAAIDYLARREGILLDPIYSGKAFSGLLDLVRRGEIKGRVCFWHTGGLPALFAG